MLDTITGIVELVPKLLPFSGPTWFVALILAFFVWIFAKSSMSPYSRVSWEDLVIDSTSNKTSPYKLGYLVGIIVSTWTVMTFVDRNTLSMDVFATYLTYLLGGAGWNSFVKNKTGSTDPVSSNSELPPQ